MGNAIYYCLVKQELTVKVMRVEGDMLEFDRPLIAKQLMKEYPGHLVVHCSQVSKTAGLGKHSKVSMLRANETLHPGQTYCLLRVPSQRGKIVLPATPDTGYPVSQTNLDAAQLEQHLHQQMQQQLNGPWKPHLDAIIENPLSPRSPSVHMSPLARQAGYVSMSPLRTAPSPLSASFSDHTLRS